MVFQHLTRTKTATSTDLACTEHISYSNANNNFFADKNSESIYNSNYDANAYPDTIDPSNYDHGIGYANPYAYGDPAKFRLGASSDTKPHIDSDSTHYAHCDAIRRHHSIFTDHACRSKPNRDY